MPRTTKVAECAAIQPCSLVVDNGAFSLKAGLVGGALQGDDRGYTLVPNCLLRDQARRVYLGPQLAQCNDFYHAAIRRPMEKGMVVHWDLERAIWQETFFAENAPLKCDPHDANLILSEAPNSFQALQSNCDQIVFEEFEFASYVRCIGPALNAYNHVPTIFGGEPRLGTSHARDCLLVVDCGYSHTTVTPIINAHPVQEAIRRLDVGGKHMTSYLTELLAIHEVNLQDQPWIANEVKEAVCFVSDDFRRDMDRTWRNQKMHPSVAVDCQLPDYQSVHEVIVQAYEPRATGAKAKSNVVAIGNERFQVPELLFNPSDIGMVEAGLPEVIMQSISVLPQGLHAAFLANIVVIGGNAKIPGFLDRLRKEVRQLASGDSEVRVACPSDPIGSTWRGGAEMATRPEVLKKRLVTRQQYLEHGSAWLLRRFATVD